MSRPTRAIVDVEVKDEPPPPDLGIDAGAVAAALVVLAFGLAGAGTGFANGDAAVYAAQASQGVLSERVVHVGYIAPAALIGLVAGKALPVLLDVVSALACAATTLGAGRLAGSFGRPPWAAAAATGVMLLPVAPFAEVDPAWVALLVWAAAVRPAWNAALLMALAVPISPLALLGLPWVATMRWARVPAAPRRLRMVPTPNSGLWLAPIVVVLVLTIATGGDWWTGDRGVLAAPWPRPWRLLQAWASEGVPWFAAPIGIVGWVVGGGPAIGAWWPFLLAPPDADAWPLLTVSLSVIAAEGVRWLGTNSRRALLALLLLAAVDFGRGAYRHVRRVAEVRAEEAAIAEVLAAMGPDDALVAPWTWGVRASVRATGDPYALTWAVPGVAPRDPTWCGRAFDRVLTLPPGAAQPLPECSGSETGPP